MKAFLIGLATLVTSAAAAMPAASAAQPVSPAAGAIAPSATPTFQWTADHPGEYSQWLLTAAPTVSGSQGRMDAVQISSSSNPNGETSYTPQVPIDAGRSWWQICEEAPDFSTTCSVPREVIVPIDLDSEQRSYSRPERTIRVTFAGNLWRGSSATIRVRGASWAKTFAASSESGSLTLDTSRIPRRVKWVRISGTLNAQGAVHQVSLPGVRTR